MFVPALLNRSNYSFLQSTLTISEIVKFAKDHGHSHVVISDFESAHSWTKFYKEARDNDLIPVFGIQVNHQNSSLLFLAKNKKGFGDLLKIASRKKDLSEVSCEDLIFIHFDGDDCFPDKKKYFANKEGEDGVFVRENKFLNEGDFEFYCVLRAINNNTSVEVERNLNGHFRLDYLAAPVEGLEEDSPQIKNIYEILSQCEHYDIFNKENTLDFFSDAEKQLREILDSRFEKLTFKNEGEKSLYRVRLEEELQVIVEKGFCEYFLIVQDAVQWSRDNGIYVGPGRGSVCGSLMAYVLGITEIDPIFYDLYFERFLNKTRTTIPDIDIDVANNRRDDLFNYLKGKYGEDNVALISTYRTFKVKNSVREVGRAYGVPIPILESYLKNVEDKLDFNERGLSLLAQDYPHMVEILQKIQNYPCNLSVHAAGVVISSKPLSETIPLVSVLHSPLLSSQWDADELKNFGFIKFDFLALQYLQSLHNIEERIAKKNGDPIIWKDVDLNDQKVYETIIKGHNLFIFQFENPKIKKLIQNFKPSTLLDLALISSIHRPGASDQIPTLLARKTSQGNGLFQSAQHEGLVAVNSSTIGPLMSILHNTYGLLIYQEQLMKIVSTATSCSFGESDSFRRGISSSPEKIPMAKKWFFSKSMNRFSMKELEILWDSIFKFAKYGFNKSHAVAYAMISYRLMWLKTYYPEIFYSEFLSNNLNSACFYELEESGYIITAPSYGKSDYRFFRSEGEKFYFPVNAISGLNLELEKFEAISGEATTAIDAIKELIGLKISLPSIRILIRAGFFSELMSSEESEFFLESNLEIINDNMIVKEDGTPLYNIELKSVEFTPEERKRYRAYQNELLGIDINRCRIASKVFQKYKSLSRINTLASQTMSVNKYIGFLSEAKIAETYREDLFLLLRISDGFYTTPRIALFGKPKEELEKWQELSKSNVPVILDIEKNGDNYKVVNMREINQKTG